MSKPDFLCIGMQKGGTTWLYNVLKNHPQLGLLPAKELVYFNSYGIEEHKQWPLYHRRRQAIQGLAHELNTGKNLDHNEDFFNRLRWYSKFSSTKVSKEWYENLFDIAPDDAVKGDFTPDYIMLPCDIIREIKNNYPNVKAIFSARSPIDRTWSHVKMIVRNEGHDLADESKIQGIIQREDVKRRGFFSEDMKNWANVFDDNFFFYKFEYIKTSPLSLLQEISKLLKIEYKEVFFDGYDSPTYAGQDGQLPSKIKEVLEETYEQEMSFYNSLPTSGLGSFFNEN